MSSGSVYTKSFVGIFIILCGYMNKEFVNLFTLKNDNHHWEANGKFYYLFPAWAEKQMEGIRYRMLIFDNEADYKTRLDGKEKVDAKMICSIKEKSNDKGTWLGWMLFDRDNKKAFFVNLYDNNMKAPGKEHDKLIVLKETERRELPKKAEEKSPFEAVETGD